RQRGAAARLPAHPQAGAPGARPPGARVCRPRCSREALAERAVRRPATARGHRACARDGALALAGGRAHRQPRFDHQGGDHAALAAAQPRARHHHRDGHARARYGPVRRAHHSVSRRAHPAAGGRRMILSTLLMALRELRRNTLRSLLTMLGIVIGVGAVIALTNIGEGATARVKSDIGKLGDNLLIVRPGAQRRSISFTQAPPFKMADVEAITREVSGVSAVAPTVGSTQLAVWGNQNRQTTIMGADNAYLDVRGYAVSQGRKFASSELSSGSAACVLGAT